MNVLLPPLRRELPFLVLDSGRNFVDFSFSSEFAVERDFGTEILSHADGAPDFSRINNSSCPWLFNHNRDQYLGIIKRAWLDKKKGICRAEWSSASEVEGSWAWTVRQDIEKGILPNTSFLYQINKLQQGRSGQMVATSWTPYEISTVTIPADPTVGMGRSELFKSKLVVIDKGGKTVSTELDNDLELEPVEAERLRVRSIVQLCKRHNMEDLEAQFIDQGFSLDAVRKVALERLEGNTTAIAAPLGLSRQEQKNYSLIRAVQAFLSKDWSKAGLELECSREIAKQTDRQPTGFFFPMGDLGIDRSRMAQRAPLFTGSSTAAGDLIATNLDSANFVEILRNKALITQMGARMISNLNGNLDVPRQTGSAQAYWVAEGAGPTESNLTVDLISFRPKTVGAITSMTRTMMMQSSLDIEMLVRDDLAQIIALEIDRVVIDGSGTNNQPTGILNTAGIGSEVMGTDGAAFTNLDKLIDLETKVAVANADFGSLYYLTNPKVIGALKKLKSSTNEYLWNGYESPIMAGVPGEINGYPVGRTNQVPSNKTKGNGSNLSSLIFGNFADVYIAMWGVLDILPNLYGTGYTAGNVELRALQTMDVKLARPASFGAITDIVTA